MRPGFDLSSKVSRLDASLFQLRDGMVVVWLSVKQSNMERVFRCLRLNRDKVKFAPSLHSREFSSTGPMLRPVMYQNPSKKSQETPCVHDVQDEEELAQNSIGKKKVQK